MDFILGVDPDITCMGLRREGILALLLSLAIGCKGDRQVPFERVH
jgi:hypothetical protein